MTPLCAAVSASDFPGSTSIPVKVETSSSPMQRVDQLVHVHCLEKEIIQPLLPFTIATALTHVVPAAFFPVARTPLVTSFTLAPGVSLVVIMMVLIPTMCLSVAWSLFRASVHLSRY